MLPSAAVNVALVLAGIAVLLLFCAQPSSREYFWLGLYLLLVGTSFGLYTAFLTGLIPKSFNDFYADPIIYVFSCAQIEFIFAFVHRRVNRFWRMYEFVTCLCARIEAEGNLILANAGHLSPYRNGEEIQLESGLPLGIAPDVTYCESTICLAPDDQLTFLSDGVIEARNSQGELFGFDRTAAIATQSADEIAVAAQSFGQEDDITVLTVQRSAPCDGANA
jgi:hypothetical protein